MDDDEPVQETNSSAHVRIGSTLPARFVLLSSLSNVFFVIILIKKVLAPFFM